MSNLTSVAKDRLEKKAKAAEAAKGHIESADQPEPPKEPEKEEPEKEERPPQKRLNVEIPEDLHKAVRRQAVDEDTNIREWVIKALKGALKV
jgi:predicted HicB family RNase H-like nuclease